MLLNRDHIVLLFRAYSDNEKHRVFILVLHIIITQLFMDFT